MTLLATTDIRSRWVGGESDKAPAVSCRRRDILRLSREQHETWASSAERSFLLGGPSRDWISEQDITIASHHSLALDIHHVFPQKWCLDNHIDPLRRESIVNKTALSAATNRKLGGQAPSKYLPRLEREAETATDTLRRRPAQHHVSLDRLAADDFEGFFEERRNALLELVSAAMGKAVTEPAMPRLPEDFDLDDEDLRDEDVAEVVATAGNETWG